ncbi:hypothetical protein niasHT_009600 [Heterodera trifolii]|uniref:Uncharacterized protein n=1 Tax=Heterodera trifolii TaxID=157864 RepID=A0ABD2M5B6_9BILA
MDSTFFSAMAVLSNAGLTPLVVALAIGVPSALLYGVELGVIIANFCHFRSSFFVRVILASSIMCSPFLPIASAELAFSCRFYLRLPRLVLALLYFVVYYAFHVENLLTAFLLLNRFTSFWCQ